MFKKERDELMFKIHGKDERICRLENEVNCLKAEINCLRYEKLKEEIREIATTIPKDKFVSEILISRYYDDAMNKHLEDEFWNEMIKPFHIKGVSDFKVTLICNGKGEPRVELLLKDISELEEIRKEKEEEIKTEVFKEVKKFEEFIEQNNREVEEFLDFLKDVSEIMR